MYTDQTGKFSVTSRQDYKYMMIPRKIDSGAILVEPMKTKLEGKMFKTYQTLANRLHVRRVHIKRHILDDKCSKEFKNDIKKKELKDMLVPLWMHRRNIAENLIPTFEDYLTLVMCGTVDKLRIFL